MSILVVGDAMIDRYWYGEATRLSPDAPVPVVSVHKTEDRPGAAANVARNIAAMGGKVRRLFSASFYDDPVIKVRILGRGHHMVRADFDRPQKPIDMEHLRSMLKDANVVVLSDYGKGALHHVAEVVREIVKAECLLLVDPKGYRYEKYRGAHVVKPNMEEMRAMCGGWESEEELEHKANVLRQTCGIEALLVTRGAGGMTYFNGRRYHIQAVECPVVDVSGAGEAAIAALAVALDEEYDFPRAAEVANRAASKAIQSFGTTVISRAGVFDA